MGRKSFWVKIVFAKRYFFAKYTVFYLNFYNWEYLLHFYSLTLNTAEITSSKTFRPSLLSSEFWTWDLFSDFGSRKTPSSSC